MPIPFLLDETAVIGWAFNFLLVVGGGLVAFLLWLGWHFFVSRASTGRGRLGRFLFLLLAVPLAACALLYSLLTSLM
jgi:hypothetical protein